MPTSRRLLSVCTLFALLVATRAFAATFLVEGYAMRVWQTEDGLPENMVTSAVQTRDGYLWFGTYNGLVRFDGERFQTFDSANTPGLQDRRVTNLFEDEQGTVWIGHEAGGVTRLRDGRFDPVVRSSGTIGDKIIGIGSDETGQLWVMRENGTLESVTTKGRRLASLIAPELPGAMSWTRDPRGGIWVSENGRVARLEQSRLVEIPLLPPVSNNYVLDVAASPNGGAWVFCDGRVRKWEDGHWSEDRGPMLWPNGPVACARELRDGTLAVGTIYSGLYLYFKGGQHTAHFDRSNGLPQNWVRFLQEDREGNLWAGTGSAGMVSIHATPLSVLTSPDQWQGCTVLAVAPGHAGTLWVGTDGAGLYRYAAGYWKHFGEAEGLVSGYIPAVTESPQGDVWAGHFWWGSPYHLENGHFVRPSSVDEKSSPVFALLAAPDSSDLLVGTRDGLLQLKDNAMKWLVKAPEGPAGAASAIARDHDGAIWCGFGEGGLARVVDGKVTMFHPKDGLPSDSVMCLSVDEAGSLWIGTVDGGLSRFKNGRFSNLTPAQGLIDSYVGYVLDDGLGYFWLSTHHGLQRIAKTELNRCADGAIATLSSQIYDQHDGLPTIEFVGGFQAAGCKTNDGRLWFASSKGPIGVDPSRIVLNPTPPPVAFESLLVDGNPVPLDRGVAPDRLSPDNQRLEFRYTGLSFVAPSKVLFKYRLDGIDHAWIDAGSRRTAFYSHLPAGRYRFRVIACNNDRVWNTEGASVEFTVAPYFWQTWWFISASLLAAAGAIAWLARYVTRRRMQRHIEQIERRHELERERARIAQDIHDDVGASLSRIAMLSQPTRSDFAEPERTAAMLTRIYTTAREVTRSLDEIVWAVDPRHDTLESLVDYMGKFAQSFLTAAALRCRLDLPVEVPALPLTAEVRHNLFLAFKEALNNAAKHAGASEVRISFRLLPGSFVLEVKDNGRGFDGTPSSEPDRIASGHGLANMQARLSRIGGECEISSAPGGTSVRFVVKVTHLEDAPVPEAVKEKPAELSAAPAEDTPREEIAKPKH